MSVQLVEQVMVPMRDGTRLATNVYVPERSGGPWPALLLRTPYGSGPESAWHEAAQLLAARGYAVVNQDVRGRYLSEGHFEAESEGADGYDTIAWVRAQPWCNGKVGVYGPSYMAWTQFAAARQHPPGLTALFAVVGDHYWQQFSQWGRHHGVLRQLDLQSWFLGVAVEDSRVQATASVLAQFQAAFTRLPDLQAWRDAPREGAYPILDSVLTVPAWADVWPLREWPLLKPVPDYFAAWQRNFAAPGLAAAPAAGDSENIEVPTFLVGGWFDIFLAGTIASYQSLVANAPDERAARAHRLLIGPWGHSLHAEMSGEIGAGADADLDQLDVQRRWFDHWLRQPDPDFDVEPPVRYYTMGANTWRTCCKWPPGGITYTPYYIHSPGDRAAHRANARGTLSRRSATWDHPQRYTYDPRRPVPTRGGNTVGLPWGSYDQRPVTGEARDDVLSFTGEPLTAPLEVTGPVQAVLYASSSALDTDFTVKLLDVRPDGRMLNVCAGIIRARYRSAGQDSPAPLQPERVYRFDVDLLATSYLFRPGHRLRVDISSSNFPQFDRNANTGQPLGTDRRADTRTAQQTIYHDALRPSHIILPVIAP